MRRARGGRGARVFGSWRDRRRCAAVQLQLIHWHVRPSSQPNWCGPACLLFSLLCTLLFLHSCVIFLILITAGHSDWVKSISFSPPQPDASLILASGSQDYTIRLTRIFPASSSSTPLPSSVGTFGQKLQAFPSRSLSSCPSSTPLPFVCELYSVLRAHTDWVHSVRWLTSSPYLCLFSASADKSIALWREGADGVWCETRAGRIGGGVMSFCGGACSNSGDRLMAHSHTGGVRG